VVLIAEMVSAGEDDELTEGDAKAVVLTDTVDDCEDRGDTDSFGVVVGIDESVGLTVGE
jgi:hypothetical protein